MNRTARTPKLSIDRQAPKPAIGRKKCQANFNLANSLKLKRNSRRQTGKNTVRSQFRTPFRPRFFPAGLCHQRMPEADYTKNMTRLALAAALFAAALPAPAAVPTMPLRDIHAGMHGTGKTVFEGDRIQ